MLRGRRSDDAELRHLLAQRNLSAAHGARRPEDARIVESWLDATTPDVIADEIEAITHVGHAQLIEDPQGTAEWVRRSLFQDRGD